MQIAEDHLLEVVPLINVPPLHDEVAETLLDAQADEVARGGAGGSPGSAPRVRHRALRNGGW